MNPNDNYGANNQGGAGLTGPAGDPSSAGYPYEGANDVLNNSTYLGEIAVAAPPKQAVWPKWLAIILGGIAVLAGLVFVVMSAASDPKPSIVSDAQSAYGRAETLATLSRNFRQYFDSGELRGVSSEFQVVLEGFQRNVEVILEANGVKSPAAPKSEADYLAELDQKLKDARILSTLDRVYVSEMTYQIEAFRALLFGLEQKLTVIDHREFISTAYEQLEEMNVRLNRILLN
ncbi:MAG: hypothetical protein LBM12_01215 [Candidatus Nomurabacteria bacterium]|jgi:hypothetical protein|nr:hypothetical protein [Candidatus Nomurabacteria bacterium]